jgi:voltage-gated potassium channel
VIIAGALGFHYFEFGKNANVKTFFDSVWWAIVTTTTIGYGDIYPVTTGGRIVAIILIFTGISALGAFIAAVDAYFINKNRKEILKKIEEKMEEKT